jgi:hypothetical protein
MPNRYAGVDPVLTNVAIAYTNDAYIADQIYPTLSVKSQTGKHFIYDRQRFRLDKTKRGIASPSNEITLSLTTGLPYICEDHAIKQFVPDEDVENAVISNAPFIDATENVTEKLLVEEEVNLATTLADTAVLTQNTTLSGTSQWSDYNNSDPFTNVETGLQTIHSAIHQNANILLMGKQVWDKIKHHPDLLERVKYSQKAVMTTELLASLLGVDRILIGAAGYNTAKEGQADSMSYIWGKHAWLLYVNPRIQQRMITFGFTYRWSAKTKKVERLRGTSEEDRKGTYVRVGDSYYDQNLVSASAAYLIKNAVA